jgi:hypothetical protein
MDYREMCELDLANGLATFRAVGIEILISKPLKIGGDDYD